MTLDKNIEQHTDNVYKQKAMEDFQWSRAQIIFHATWYFSFVSKPQIKDFASQAQNVLDLAKNEGTK